MARYFIEDVKCGVGTGGMACGPVSGPVVGEAKVRDSDGKTFYFSLAEVDGYPNFFLTDRSTYNQQISSDISEEELEYLDENYYPSIEGDYDVIFTTKEEFNPMLPLMKYLIYLVRADWEECERFQKETKGKYLDEFKTPPCDLEEEYLDTEES